MLLFIDTETTGKYDFNADPKAPHQPRVVQLAAILFDRERRERALLHTLISPLDWSMPPDAQAVHGITEDECRKFGMYIGVALHSLLEMCMRSELMIAHNADYDASVLIGEFARREFGPPLVLKPQFRFCTMKVATPIVKLPGRYGDYKWPKLSEAYQHFFKEELTGAHDALADVRACARIYFALKDQGAAA